MTPREMFIEGILMFNYPGNCHKRVHRIEKLADSIGAKVSYGLNSITCGIETADGLYYEAGGMRDTEAVLRWLKRQA